MFNQRDIINSVDKPLHCISIASLHGRSVVYRMSSKSAGGRWDHHNSIKGIHLPAHVRDRMKKQNLECLFLPQ